jgi:hypothetical protein
LYSIPFLGCSSIDIPDSVEVLCVQLSLEPDRHLVLTFGPGSRLNGFQTRAADRPRALENAADTRAFVRLSESTLRAFRNLLATAGVGGVI